MSRVLPAIALLLLICACKSSGLPPLPPEEAPLFPVWKYDGVAPAWTYRVMSEGQVFETTFTGFSYTWREFPGLGKQRAGKQLVGGGKAKTIYLGYKKEPYCEHFGTSRGSEDYDPPIKVLSYFPDTMRNWDWEGQYNGRPSRAKVAVLDAQSLTLPAGTYKTVPTRERHEQLNVTVERWFARGVGLVKLVKHDGGKEVLRLELLQYHRPK